VHSWGVGGWGGKEKKVFSPPHLRELARRLYLAVDSRKTWAQSNATKSEDCRANDRIVRSTQNRSISIVHKMSRGNIFGMKCESLKKEKIKTKVSGHSRGADARKIQQRNTPTTQKV